MRQPNERKRQTGMKEYVYVCDLCGKKEQGKIYVCPELWFEGTLSSCRDGALFEGEVVFCPECLIKIDIDNWKLK